MRLISTLFIFISLAGSVSAQKMFEEQFSNCLLKFVMEDEETLVYYDPNDSIMVQDFIQGLEEKQLDKLMGAVMMQIMVDTVDQLCCVSYTNKTTINNKKFDVPGKILNMKGWRRAPNALPEENICALVSIIFDKKEITVMRTGYNRNTGRKIMESTTYNRFPEPKPVIQDSTIQKM